MVILSVGPSVTTRYRFKTSRDIAFGFSLYDSLVPLVFRDKISCHWVKGVPTNKGQKRGTLFKKTLSYRIGSSNEKMVADRQRRAAYHSKHWQRAS